MDTPSIALQVQPGSPEVAESIAFSIKHTTAEWWKLYINETEVAYGLIGGGLTYEKTVSVLGYEVELANLGNASASQQMPFQRGYVLALADGLGTRVELRLM